MRRTPRCPHPSRTSRSVLSLLIPLLMIVAPLPFSCGRASAQPPAPSAASGAPFPASPSAPVLFELRIPLVLGASASAIPRNGASVDLGRVVALPEKTRFPGYTATRWGVPGTTAASAVNAIHLLIGIENGKGRTLSLLPRETIAPAAGPGAAVVLDARAGTGIFGAWAPPVDTPVQIEGLSGDLRPLSSPPLPREGEVLVLRVTEGQMPVFIEIENRPGGRAVAWRRDGSGVLARVIRPVRGVGRFEGTLFQDVGRLRANHPGVVDVSTSPLGQIGGFQIIPFDHGKSAEMQGAWTMTQWLILAAPDGTSRLSGTPPLFAAGLVPGPAEGEDLWDLWSTYGRRPLVLCRIDGGPWRKLPPVAGKVDEGLAKLTHLRIYFPLTEEPLRE